MERLAKKHSVSNGTMMFLSLYLVSFCCTLYPTPNPLSEYTWKNRVIILYSPGPGKQYQEQLSHLTSVNDGLKDRDLVIIELFESHGRISTTKTLSIKDHAYLKQKYVIPGDTFRFVLIGKDGSVKLDRPEFISSTRLFSIIDKMPMRIQEMKNKQ